MSTSYSAGMLPINVINGELYFLLGKDRNDNSWSDFGGRAEECDGGNCKETAAREFLEESLGVVMEMDSIRNRLKDPDSHKRLDSRTMGGLPYYMFLIHCPYNTWYPTAFRRNLKFLKHMNCHRRYLEKTDIAWFPASEIMEVLDGKRSRTLRLREIFAATLRAHRDVIENAEKHVVNRYPSPNRVFSEEDRHSV